jgi:flotillin
MAEANGEVASKLARAEADVAVQKARVEQVRRQLQADVLEPARARKAAAEATAKGAASKIVEQGRANAAAMQDIATAWHDVGDNARNVFLLQKVDGLMRQVMETVSGLKVERLTVLGGIGGGGGGDGAGSATGKVIAAAEQLKAATGVDLLAAVRDRVVGPLNPGR